jgi:hypothetical protein
MEDYLNFAKFNSCKTVFKRSIRSDYNKINKIAEIGKVLNFNLTNFYFENNSTRLETEISAEARKYFDGGSRNGRHLTFGTYYGGLLFQFCKI